MIKFLFFLTIVFLFMDCINLKGQIKETKIIAKDNGNIILAYKGFERFLNSNRSWENYEELVLNSFPPLLCMHQRYINVGLIDSNLFRKEVTDYTLDSFKPYLENISEQQITNLYDSVISQMDYILTPLKKVDVCFFLSNQRDCFVQDVNGRQTVYISIKYDIKKMNLILAHEYAHCLHHQRRSDEPSVLKRWIVSEGIASFFPVLLSKENSIYNGLWMMPKENVDWCKGNESRIINVLLPELEKKGLDIEKKYIAGGEGFANPPEGFPEKIGYYIGYRIIENCLNKGISLSEICKMDSQTIINLSKFFDNHN